MFLGWQMLPGNFLSRCKTRPHGVMALTHHFVEDKRNCVPSFAPLENHEAGKCVSISTLQIKPAQMIHEQRLVTSFSIHVPTILLQPNGGTHGSWSSTRPACRFHRARGLSTSPADPQRRSLRRRGVSWDGRFMLTSPWWSTLGLQPWPGTLSWLQRT